VAKTVKVQQAKTHLSSLLAEVEDGREVVIARGDKPIARLLPIRPAMRDLGFLAYAVPDAFLEDLPEEELAAWGQ
jgi:prevent-host-death family protein